MFTFHSIDTVNGKLGNKECLNYDELNAFMVEAESKYWACQVVCDITGKKITYQIGDNGQWEAVKKEIL